MNIAPALSPTIEPLGTVTGAVIRGVDLAKPQSDATIAARRATR